MGELVEGGLLTLGDMVRRMSTTPARILGLEGQGGPVVPGAWANLVVFDPGARWTVDPGKFASRSRNCPWAAKELVGRVLLTVFQGRVVGRDGQVFTAPPLGAFA
jgi:dihydroorotase